MLSVILLGTGGSFAGCAARFKEHDLAVQCYIVEPQGAAALAGQKIISPDHRIQGGGYSMPYLAMLRSELIDGFLTVSDDEAIESARRLAREAGLFVGPSSGANVAAALQLLKTTHSGRTIVVLLCDSGLKYLSTGLYP